MEFMTAKDAASKWGITQRRVSTLCSENRIEGAEFVGNMWLIPKTAEKPEDGRVTRFEPPVDMPVKPFLKWAGGKSQILDEIRNKYPDGLGTRYNKYAEPFVGGGAVLFDVLGNYNLDSVYISDVNRELITTYTIIRDAAEELIDMLAELERHYHTASDEIRKEMYYANRDRFNVLKAASDESVEAAAMFIFLNRTCFNGLYRVNSHGAYNVPQGSYKNPAICDKNNLRAVSSKLNGVEIMCADFKESRDFIDDKTFAYFDPPYRPLTTTASFTAYATNGFGDDEQKDLARFIDEMSRRGVHIVASNNRIPPNKQVVAKEALKEYVIVTNQGFTQSPTDQEVENQQILGYERGVNAYEAIKKFFLQNNGATHAGFESGEAIAYQVVR
jgi:DNA adenine methylase